MAFNPQTGRFEPDVPQTGLIGSEQALRGGLETSLGALQEGFGAARQDLAPFLGQSAGAQAAEQQGMQAGGIQAALTGALGPEAQYQLQRI